MHAVAYAPAEDLKGEFINTSREGFRIAHDVSVYSLIAVSRGAVPLMTEGGSIITLTYYAAEKVVPHYNVMALAKASLESAVRYLAYELGPKNIRVNAISAGPSRRWPRAAWAHWAICSSRTPSARRCTATWIRRGGWHGALPGQRSGQRRYRRSHLRRLRLQHHGVLEPAEGEPSYASLPPVHLQNQTPDCRLDGQAQAHVFFACAQCIFARERTFDFP